MGKSIKVVVRVTDRCNNDCFYCYVDRATRRNSKIRLSLTSLKRLYTELLSGETFDHIHFVWHGGEPTLVGAAYLDRAVSLQSYYRGSGVVVENSIQTNAIAIKPGMIDVFRKHNIGVGISLDAPPDVHDALRRSWIGHGTLARVLRSIDRMRTSGLTFGAICVLHQMNVHRATEIYRFFKGVGLNYQLNPFYRDEAASADATARLCITPDEYAHALIESFDCWITDPDPTVSISDLKEIVISMFTGRARCCLFSGQCHEFIGILPNGEIYHCDMFSRPESRIGHIATIKASDVIAAPSIHHILRRPSILRETHCRECEWWEMCHGGCSSKAAAVYGNVLREDPFCRTRQALFPYIAARLRNLEGKEVMKSAGAGD